MNQLTFDAVAKLTLEHLGAIENPLQLAATRRRSPMIARYIVRTRQLESRYPGATLLPLLNALDQATREVSPFRNHWLHFAHHVRDTSADSFLDELQPQVRSLLQT